MSRPDIVAEVWNYKTSEYYLMDDSGNLYKTDLMGMVRPYGSHTKIKHYTSNHDQVQKILGQSRIHFKNGMKFHDVPGGLEVKIERNPSRQD